jgi:hypothetical protein
VSLHHGNNLGQTGSQPLSKSLFMNFRSNISIFAQLSVEEKISIDRELLWSRCCMWLAISGGQAYQA